MDKVELEQYLRLHGIPLEEWGKGESKTIDHLHTELQSGESRLSEDSRGNLMRTEVGVGINVLHKDGGQLLELYEIKQVFTGNRERQRNLNTSVGEKIKPGESPDEAAERTLREELGIIGVALLNCRLEDRYLVASKSFPGLVTKRNVNVYDAYVAGKNFSADGYIERQVDKITYFGWRESQRKESGLQLTQLSFVEEMRAVVDEQQLTPARLTSRIKQRVRHDLIGARLILGSDEDCYRATKLISATYQVDRYRDYITDPWGDGYQSIHIDLQYQGVPVETQVRTPDMDKKARELIRVKGNHYWKEPGFKKFN